MKALIIGSKVHADDLQLRCQSLHSGFQPVGNRFAFCGCLLTHTYLWTQGQNPDPHWNSTDPYLKDRFSKWQELVVCSHKAHSLYTTKSDVELSFPLIFYC